MDTLHTIFVTHAIYEYGVIGYSDPSSLSKPTW